ncbi:MAG: hypothetical protein M1136_09265 [Chloroflexi bacterium]|nr:hypothetical protein [Chloroflexota bacterium]
MVLLLVTRLMVVLAFIAFVTGLMVRLRPLFTRTSKRDLSTPRGSALRGVLYAFTLGMAPWEKESTRIHWVAYLRGIFFHLGIFAGFAVLLLSLGVPLDVLRTPPFAPLRWFFLLLTGLGTLCGAGAIIWRYVDKGERALSTPDDYFSAFLVTFFVAAAFLTVLGANTLLVFYIISAIMLALIPFTKIRHFIYFFFAKYFFGMQFGHRGVLKGSGIDGQSA